MAFIREEGFILRMLHIHFPTVAPLPIVAGYTTDDQTTFTYDPDTDRNVAYYSVSGWMDGGGYSTGTIQRHLWLPGASAHFRA